MLEFIARHGLENDVTGDFDSRQILHLSEIGLASEEVVTFAGEVCVWLGVAVFRQEPNPTFTPVGNDQSLLILPAKDRMWITNSDLLAKLLPVKVIVDMNGRVSKIRGVPYHIA